MKYPHVGNEIHNFCSCSRSIHQSLFIFGAAIVFSTISHHICSLKSWKLLWKSKTKESVFPKVWSPNGKRFSFEFSRRAPDRLVFFTWCFFLCYCFKFCVLILRNLQNSYGTHLDEASNEIAHKELLIAVRQNISLWKFVTKIKDEAIESVCSCRL